MTASKLDRKVQFQRAVQAEGPFGVEETWQNLGAPVSASKKDISDGERWQAQQVQASVTTRFVVRFSSLTRDVDAKDRLVCEHRTYDIVGTKEIGRREFVEITSRRRND